MLYYSAHEANGVLIFTVEDSESDEAYSSQREWLYKTIESRDDPKFIIDLGALNYLGSSDIGLLITLKRRIDARKGKVALVNVDSFIVDVLRTMRIDKLFTISDDMSTAVAAVTS
ncbi:MAG: STAS domain-containing protein [Isosphaeraceae bacterium]